MRSSALLSAALAPAALAAIKPKNFIYIIPDGFAPASQTLLRDYSALINDGSPADEPAIKMLPVDLTPIGYSKTESADNLVTDSAAAGTALASGVKTDNYALGVTPEGKPVGTLLEAAKLKGLDTALVVTSVINHATPGAFSAHVLSRNAYDAIAEQQIGYSNVLGQSVDLLFGGGACSFRPSNQSDSCREDDIDLFAFAEEQGYFVAQDRAAFEELGYGLGDVKLPILGLFADSHLAFETDRVRQAEDVREPSLSELTRTALNTLDKSSNDKGYFIMIEASRIDHAGHANDVAAHLWDTAEYNKVVNLVTEWIDEHPDTAMISVADHECGGLTLPSGFDPTPLASANHSTEYLLGLWEDYDGSDRRGYLEAEILPAYGLSNTTDEEVDAVLASEDFTQTLGDMLAKEVGMNWSSNDHSAVDVTVYAYAAGKMGTQLRMELGGAIDNTDIPKYIEEALGLDMAAVTELLNKDGIDWVPTE